jgi:CrcB protein
VHSVGWAYLTVAVGGAAGAVARFGLTGLLMRHVGSIPLGTLASNLSGCFVMGVIAQLVAGTSWFNDAGLFPDHYRLLFAVGFCGSFTTLSSLVFEISVLMQREQLALAFAYLMVTLLGGFACFYLAASGVRWLLPAQ